jgi:uncharacterized protein (TIGR02145 family)/uncharacterized repeat protein (TIGR02543 family)
MKKNNFIFTALLTCALFLSGCKKDNLIVNYDANSGIGNMPAQEFERDVPQALSPNAFYLSGHEFKGWNAAADGSGTRYRNQQIITLKSEMTLYAQWKPFDEIFYVLFEANGGKGSMKNQPFYDNEFQELTANTFTRANYIFTGWNTKADGSGTRHDDQQRIRLTTNKVLYAQWISEGGCPGTPTVTDKDGNKYNTVQIGSQCWMRENLKTTKYNTGVSIPIKTTHYDWSNAIGGALCYYEFDTNNMKYGVLYNNYTAMSGDLCPQGWHVPSAEEWNTLVEHLGGDEIAGYKMKAHYDWHNYLESSGGGSNESGFSALPAGIYQMGFGNINELAGFWSSTENEYYVQLFHWGSSILGQCAYYYGTLGCSVRCVKD